MSLDWPSGHFSGDKGTGKSTASIEMCRDYIKKYSFICPKCGAEFYKNVYTYDINKNNEAVFFIHPGVTNNKIWIKCPEEYELNTKTGQKKKVSGCGYEFPYSQRKRILWDAKKFIAYDNADILKKIHSLPTYSPIIADEAIKFAAGMNHNKTESKELKELFTVVRPKRFWFFFCVPEFQWIDSKYREGMSNFWLRMIERGTGILFEKDKGEAIEKYHMKELQKKMGVVKYFTDMDTIRRSLTKHPCYFDTFHFKGLPETIYNNYEMVRNAVNLQRQIEERQLSNKDIGKMMAWNLMNYWDTIRIAVDKSRNSKITYKVLIDEILRDPLTKKPLVSDQTMRNWLRGIDEYIKSKGSNVLEFDGEVQI